MKEIINEVQDATNNYKPIYQKLSGAKSDSDYLTLPDAYRNIKLIEKIRDI